MEGGLGYFCPQKKHVSWDASILFAITSQTPTIAANCFYNIIPNLPPPTPYFFFHHFPKSISKSFHIWNRGWEALWEFWFFYILWLLPGNAPRPPPLSISYLWLPLISDFAFLAMHRLNILFRPDHSIIWFVFCCCCFFFKKYTFLDVARE